MELYMMNRPHGRIILASVEKGPLVWPSITVDGVTRLKEYTELTPVEAIQADCDIKDLWEKIKLLMQGTSLTKQERECKLYDEFDKFTYKKGESLHEYYLRFTLLLNDMNIYKMPLEQFQVNTNLNNTQLHQSSTPLSVTYPSNDFQSSIHHNVYSPSSSIPQLEYPPQINQQSEFSQQDSGLIVLVFQKGDRTYTPGASGSNSGKQRMVICYNCKGEGHMSRQCTKPKRKRDDSWFKEKVLLVQAQAHGQILNEDELAFLADPDIPEGQSTLD
ncbi:integrase, catalytic region, zinc finger, CCHC-type containing protein [Tanacetum coccineum]